MQSAYPARSSGCGSYSRVSSRRTACGEEERSDPQLHVVNFSPIEGALLLKARPSDSKCIIMLPSSGTWNAHVPLALGCSRVDDRLGARQFDGPHRGPRADAPSCREGTEDAVLMSLSGADAEVL